MSEGRPTISSARVAIGDIAHHSFTVVRRGFDTSEVRSYLQAVARNLEELEHRSEELRVALATADERAAHPVIDEATLTASLGQHSAQVLRHAHDEAARIVVQAQESSTALLREAQNQANEIQESSEASSAERVAETELMVAAAEEEARVEAARLHSAARAEGDEVIARAKDEGRALLEQVQVARKRVLAEMSTRRRALTIQIEQLRAARDEMAATIHGVRDSVDGILVGLQRSDDSARAAAASAGDEARLRGPTESLEELVGIELVGIASEETAPVDDVAPAAETPSVAPTEVAPADELPTDAAPTEIPPSDAPPTEETPTAAPATDLGGPADLDESAGGDPPSVDELFARIRAGTGVAKAGAVTASVALAEHGSVAVADDVALEVPVDVAEVDVEVDPGSDPVTDVASAHPDQALIERRAELLTPVTAQLSRHVKRALGDDQNRMLDILRNAPTTRGEELLGPEEVQLATFAAAAHGHLADAFVAGASFAGGKAAKGPTEAAAEQSAAGLARTVVTMLRRRIGDGTDEGEDVSTRVGAAFREWRGERIERLVGDSALQAFSAGVLAAATKKGTVRWILTSPDGCSDCDDNALAGAVPVAEGFPTGHAAPPAHAGCRCLVTPTPA